MCTCACVTHDITAGVHQSDSLGNKLSLCRLVSVSGALQCLCRESLPSSLHACDFFNVMKSAASPSRAVNPVAAADDSFISLRRPDPPAVDPVLHPGDPCFRFTWTAVSSDLKSGSNLQLARLLLNPQNNP